MPSKLDALRWDSAFWRDLARRGAAHGPAWLQRWSPAPIGLAFAAWPTHQRATLQARLREVLGPRGRHREALDLARSYMCFAHSLADSLALSASPSGDVVHVQAEGVPLLASALDQGRGVVVGTAHTAGWEVALAALRRYCPAPITVVMRKERDAQARRLHATLSNSADLTVTEVGDDPLASLPLVAQLRRGGIVALQMDRCPAGTRCRVGVGEGVQWRLPAGPFVLAAASGAPIVIALSRRTSHRQYTIWLSSSVELPKHPSEDVWQAAADQIARDLVRFVRGHPDQWFAFDR